MKKILAYFFPALILLAGCSKNISSLNVPTKQPASVPPGPVFTYAVRNLMDGNADCSVSINIFRHIVEHWCQATNEDGAQYSFNIDNTCDNWWNRLYVAVLGNLKNCDSLLVVNAAASPAAVIKNERAIVDIMEVYAFNQLTETFGNVPYSQALNSNVLTPVYDDAKAIQQDLQKRLTADIAALDPTNIGFAYTEDLLYGGASTSTASIPKWVALANTLQIKIAMTLADVDNANSKTIVEADNAKAFQTTATDAVWLYYGVPNNNPTYQALVLSGRSDYVACTKLINNLIGMSDPRLPAFFGTNSSGTYSGSYIGSTVVFASVSKPAAALQLATTPYVFMDLMDLEFYRAEAIERGYNVPGTAEQHYDTAVTLSMRYWGCTQTQINTYLARPDVAYSTAAGTWRQKIGFQKWIALYCRGFDGYTELRRFDWPTMDVPTGAVSGFPTRFTYPATIYTEQGLNPVNYQAAAAAMGGDKATFKLYWDVN